jgi:flavodoxin/Pyruvate/2-oxoacid:ferredoxin oxidoreductase delta subunit
MQRMSILKKVVLFYFSGTGNTWWVTCKLTEALGQLGMDTSMYSVESLQSGQADRLIAECHVVGFGFPVHGSDVPEVMKDFMQKISPVEKQVILYCTQWLWSGDGARVGAEFLHPGYRVQWAEHFAMPNNVSVNAFRLPYTNDSKKLAPKLKLTEKKVRKFAVRIQSGKPFLRGFNWLSVLSGYIQRGPYRRMYPRLRDDIGADRDYCTLCGYCVAICPAGNLRIEKEAVASCGTCMICLRCYSFCPAMAITYMGKRHNADRGVPYRGPVDGFRPEMLRRP